MNRRSLVGIVLLLIVATSLAPMAGAQVPGPSLLEPAAVAAIPVSMGPAASVPPTGEPGIRSTWPGPDGFGYTGQTASFNWVDITSSGTPVSMGDDDYAGPFNIGFAFPFYENSWTSFYAGSNGFLTFESGDSSLSNDCPLPPLNPSISRIALMWDDLDPRSLGGSAKNPAATTSPFAESPQEDLPEGSAVEADARQAPAQVGCGAPRYNPAPDAILIDEGFEDGAVPPAGWTRVQNNPRQSWKTAIYNPHGGAYYADCEYDDQLEQQNEWLLSPEVTLSAGTLSLWSFGSLFWCRDTNDNCDLNVYIVVGSLGGGDDIFVGRADNDWATTWAWAQSTFDLTPLLPGGPVRIGLNYYGLDGAQVGLDDIVLDTGGGGPPDNTFFYQSFPSCPVGSGACLVTEYYQYSHYGGGAAGTFEAILYANGDILVQFQDAGDEEGASSTTGIEGLTAAPDYGLTYACNTPDSIQDNLAIRYVFPTGVVATPASIERFGCADSTVAYTVRVLNYTGQQDTFNVSYSGFSWNASGPAVVGPIVDRGAATFDFQIQIPPSMPGGSQDSGTLTLTGQGSGQATVVAVLATVPIGQEWSADPPMATPAMDNVVVGYNGLVYHIGGYGANGAVQIYNPLTSLWTTGATEPSPQIDYPVDGCMGLNSAGDPVVILFPDATGAVSGVLHRYNIRTNTWDSPAAPSGFPAAGQWAHDIVSMWPQAGVNICYISGGATTPGGGDIQTLWAYDPGTNTISDLGDFAHTPGFDFHFSWYIPWVGWSGSICVAGGVDANDTVIADTQCYDIERGMFRTPNVDLGPLPQGLWGGADAWAIQQGDDRLWIANGVDADWSLWPHSLYFSRGEGTWNAGPDPIYATYRVEADNALGGIYAMGGSAGGFNYTTHNQRLLICDVDCGTWAFQGPQQFAVPINQVIMDRTDPQWVYAATRQGMYRSTDGGSSWAAANSGLGGYGGLYVTDIVQDGLLTSTLYLGTWGYGVYRSTDRGSSWTQLRDPLGLRPVDEFGDGPGPLDLAVGGVAPDIGRVADVLPAAQKPWTGPASVPPAVPRPAAERPASPQPFYWTPVRGVAVNPQNSNEIYACIDGAWNSSQDGVYRGTYASGNWTWQRLSLGGSGQGAWLYAFAPSNSSIRYASFDGPALYRTTNGGSSWGLVAQGVIVTTTIQVAIHPTNPNIVLAGTRGAGLYRSSDGGQTWVHLDSPAFSDDTFYAIAFAPSDPNTVYAGGAAWVYRSTDAGVTWENADWLFPAWYVYGLAINPNDPAQVLLGVGQTYQGGVWKRNAVGTAFELMSRGLQDVFVLDIEKDPLDPSTVYVGTWGAGIFRSDNGGISWAWKGGDYYIYDKPYVYDIEAVDNGGQTVLYADTFYADWGPLRSTDGGETWAEISHGDKSDISFDIETVSGDPQQLLAATYDGVQWSTDGGNTWNDAATLNQGIVLRLCQFPGTSRFLAATYAGGAYRSSDNGRTWTASNSGLPDWGGVIYTYDVLCASGGTGYIGTRRVYRTTDYGATWSRYGLRLPDAAVRALDIAAAPDVLWAGISGEAGVYMLPLLGEPFWFPMNRGLDEHRVQAIRALEGSPRLVLAGTFARGVWRSPCCSQYTFYDGYLPLVYRRKL